MKKLHVEFDAIVCDGTYEEIKESPWILDYLDEALNLDIEDGERTSNLKITETSNEDIH